MRAIQSAALLAGLLALRSAATLSGAAAEDGVALAIVYDTSGSMADPVRDGTGKPAPKYVIANRALAAIATRIESFATNTPAGSPRQVQAGLFVFADPQARAAIPFGRFDAAAFRSWAQEFKRPRGGTPLGTAISAAGRAVLASGLSRKHVLVLTDGESNAGPAPAAVLADLRRQAAQQQSSLSIHFVAFDVDAKVFDGVKKLGATVLGASNESQLKTQLDFILEKKILLEDEEPAPKR
jgi:hypothetical protein